MFTNHFYSSKETNKMNGRFMDVGKLVPAKVGTNNTNHFYSSRLSKLIATWSSVRYTKKCARLIKYKQKLCMMYLP